MEHAFGLVMLRLFETDVDVASCAALAQTCGAATRAWRRIVVHEVADYVTAVSRGLAVMFAAPMHAALCRLAADRTTNACRVSVLHLSQILANVPFPVNPALGRDETCVAMAKKHMTLFQRPCVMPYTVLALGTLLDNAIATITTSQADGLPNVTLRFDVLSSSSSESMLIQHRAMKALAMDLGLHGNTLAVIRPVACLLDRHRHDAALDKNDAMLRDVARAAFASFFMFQRTRSKRVPVMPHGDELRSLCRRWVVHGDASDEKSIAAYRVYEKFRTGNVPHVRDGPETNWRESRLSHASTDTVCACLWTLITGKNNNTHARPDTLSWRSIALLRTKRITTLPTVDCTVVHAVAGMPPLRIIWRDFAPDVVEFVDAQSMRLILALRRQNKVFSLRWTNPAFTLYDDGSDMIRNCMLRVFEAPCAAHQPLLTCVAEAIVHNPTHAKRQNRRVRRRLFFEPWPSVDAVAST